MQCTVAPTRAAGVTRKQAAFGEFTGFKSANALSLGRVEGQDFHGRVAASTATARAGSKQVTVSAKKIRVAINGFGRIGRQFLRCWEGRTNSNLEVVCVNDSGGVKQASHLLKYDSTMGTFGAEVKVTGEDTFSINGRSRWCRPATPPSCLGAP
jgi:glyceraldehyde-3-phosphate dehydrogenase (NADP+) (phosphorylating)